MKFVIVFAALFALALAAPTDKEVTILRYDSDVQPEGYKFAYATSDGSSHDEEGQLKTLAEDESAIVVRGQYSFVADDGNTYTVTYIADENGFQPQGAHLPVA